MRKIVKLSFGVFVIITLLGEQLSTAQLIPHPNIRTNKITQVDYMWIWDELADAPRQIVGEDVVFWGENLGPYHNYTELTNKLLKLNESFPQFVDVFSIGKTWQNRTIWCVKLTNELVTDAKREDYIVAAHHAREIITVEDVLYFIDRIIYNETNFGTFSDLLDTTEIYVIPMLNPDGISILHWYPAQRKNMHPIDDDGDGTLLDEKEVRYYWNNTLNISMEIREDLDNDGKIGEDLPGGVDLNRNYAAFWNESEGASTNKNECTYKGNAPFSEPETRAMRDFMYEHSFNFAISLHSGTQAIIAPWGYNLTYPIADGKEFKALVSALKNITGFPAWDELEYSYKTSGEWGDYAYAFHHIRPFTIETYGNRYANTWYDFFNPPGNEILENARLVFNALLYLMEEPRLTYSNYLPELNIYDPPALARFDSEYTIRWGANDYNNDPLNFTVYASRDGLHWTVLATNLINTYTYTWNLSSIEPGAYLIKVSASDGKDSISDVSDVLLNVKQNPQTGSKPIYIWISAIIFAVIAFVYYLYQNKKAKEISSWYTKDIKE